MKLSENTKRRTISAIIPTYNRVDTLGVAINSILSQTLPPNEIIIVDDGSTDNTPNLLEGYGKKIITLHQENAGVAVARNAGMKVAKGEWVAFLDSDDFWLPERLAILHRDLNAEADDIVAHTGDVLLTGCGYKKRFSEMREWHFPDGRAERSSNQLSLVLAGILPTVTALRRDKALEAGGFPENMHVHEDTALFSILTLKDTWLFTGDILAEARRLPDDNNALGALSRENPIETQSLMKNHLEKLLLKDLLPNQRRLIEKTLSGALFRLAATEAATSAKNHRRTLLKAAKMHPSFLKGWLKALPPLLVGEKGYNIVLHKKRYTGR